MSNHRGGRKLFGETVLLQDWDKESEGEGAAQYWELFLDLLLVAAASCVADQFKETADFAEFALFYLILVNGWMLYTHHITSRFEDASLAHSMLLFLYMSGFGYSIVNVGYAHASACRGCSAPKGQYFDHAGQHGPLHTASTVFLRHTCSFDFDDHGRLDCRVWLGQQ